MLLVGHSITNALQFASNDDIHTSNAETSLHYVVNFFTDITQTYNAFLNACRT